MNLKIYKTTDDLMHALAQAITEASKLAIKERGQFNFVLSGGSSPKRLYELLATKKFRNNIDWNQTFFFFGDERFAPEDDAQRNSLMVKKALFDPLKIPKSNIFQVNTTLDPEQAALQYANTISAHFKNETIIFDFILLGLGDNSHTASLFPETDVLEATEATVKSVFVHELNTDRITMTAPLINQARHIVFLVFGKNKAEAVYRVLDDKTGTFMQYPARLIHSNEEKVEWYLDTEASSQL